MIIYGKNTVKEAVIAKRKFHKLWVDEKTSDSKFVSFIQSNHIEFRKTSKHELNLMTKDQNHQGFVAEVEDYAYMPLETLFDGEVKKVLILDQIEDPHNLGAIIRSAEASKIDAVIISKNRSAEVNSTVAKIAVGALEYVNVIQVGNLVQTIKRLKEEGFWVVGTDLDTDKTYKELDTTTSLAVIIGNEGDGMSRLVKMSCDYLVKIPMIGKVNSLNASVAAALLMYQMKNL
ncbi:MAG TPA: 23S rRNA (guanosine(2251)-2'-O)-methyltransferase RlmB [Acholeplasma sp.]|nr:23S rRNA (guanosine(2251)-2'-O)-methyltransferase RlmB [Acholeplasma sp.]